MKLWHDNGGLFGRATMNTSETDLLTSSASSATHRSSLWSELYNAGVEHMNDMVLEIRRIAPEPGSVVFLDVRSTDRASAEDPVLYSAIDVRTHLLTALPYFTGSIASSLDFLGFLQRSYPFRIQRIVTRANRVFSSPETTRSRHRFTLTAFELGIQHTLCEGPLEDLCNLLSRYFFDGSLGGLLNASNESQFHHQLQNYLRYHNHNRSFPSLEGKTALSSLRQFAPFSSVTLFDPFIVR